MNDYSSPQNQLIDNPYQNLYSSQMNIVSKEQIFQNLCMNICKHLTDETKRHITVYKSSTCIIKFAPDYQSANLTFYYQNPFGYYEPAILQKEPGQVVVDSFLAIRNWMLEDKKDDWNKAVFIMKDDGSFNINFSTI